ncbi:MAG: DUF3515 domain-containing protein [Nocardioides sp.]
MPSTPSLRLAATLAALALLVSACGKDPVSIPSVRLSAADQAVCQRVTNALPDRLGDKSRRKTQPAEALGGAWGDPAMVVQCGVAAPAELTRTSQCTVVDGVAWFLPPEQDDDPASDAVLSTVGYDPVLQLTVPAHDRGPVLAAAEAELAPIVKQYLHRVRRCL